MERKIYSIFDIAKMKGFSLTDEHLNLWGEEYQNKENLSKKNMNFEQWVEYKMWGLMKLK